MKEQHDIRKVIQYLQRTYKYKNFILWGRSMGAVASLMYMNTYKKDAKIHSLILDSPFSKLEDAIRSIGNFKTKIPKFLISMVIGSINN